MGNIGFNVFQIGKFGEFVEKAHARIYQTQTKDWMGQPELGGVKTTLDKVFNKFSIWCLLIWRVVDY